MLLFAAIVVPITAASAATVARTYDLVAVDPPAQITDAGVMTNSAGGGLLDVTLGVEGRTFLSETPTSTAGHTWAYSADPTASTLLGYAVLDAGYTADRVIEPGVTGTFRLVNSTGAVWVFELIDFDPADGSFRVIGSASPAVTTANGTDPFTLSVAWSNPQSTIPTGHRLGVRVLLDSAVGGTGPVHTVLFGGTAPDVSRIQLSESDVDSTVPTVALTAPVGTDFMPAYIRPGAPLEATATDGDTGVAEVAFFAYPREGAGYSVTGIPVGPPQTTPFTGSTYAVTLGAGTLADDRYLVQSRAVDGQGNVAWSLPQYVVADGTAPQASIQNPAGQAVRGSVSVVGTATDDNLYDFRVELTPQEGGEATVVGYGHQPGLRRRAGLHRYDRPDRRRL